MVYEVFGVHPEFPVQDPLVERGDAHEVVDAVLRKALGGARTDPPYIRDGAMAPDILPEALLVQFADAVILMLGRDVECDFRQEEVGPDARGRCDAGAGEHGAAQFIGELARCEAVE